MAARVVHRPAPIVGSCLQDESADDATFDKACPAALALKA
jgi:hypothetical protein